MGIIFLLVFAIGVSLLLKGSDDEHTDLCNTAQQEAANRGTVRESSVQPVTYERVDFSVGSLYGGAYLHIRKDSDRCRQRNHQIVSVPGKIRSITGSDVFFDVKYCQACNMYYLGYEDYARLRDSRGGIIGNFIMTHDDDNTGEKHRSHSTLSLCGYTVLSKENKLANERRYIIAEIIKRGIMSKADIVSYLSRFIDENTGKHGRSTAVKKWSSDLKWLMQEE